MCLSIDGAKESNDLNRGKGTYDKIIEALECLNENNIKFFTHSVLTKNNKNVVDEMISLSCKYGFKVQFSLLRNEDSPNKTIGLNDAEIKETIGKILNYRKAGFPFFFSYDAYKNVLNWPFSYDKQMILDAVTADYKPIPCIIKRFSCHIEANGLVYPCIVLVNKFKALNFLEVGFKKAWENLANNECKACYNVCHNDLNLIFGFKPNALKNAFNIAVDRVLHGIKS